MLAQKTIAHESVTDNSRAFIAPRWSEPWGKFLLLLAAKCCWDTCRHRASVKGPLADLEEGQIAHKLITVTVTYDGKSHLS